MPLYTVTVTGGVAVEVYGGLVACDAYLLGSSTKGAAAYRRLTAGSDERKRLLIDATRLLDRQRWQGVRNAAGGTTLDFPRTGLLLDGLAASDAAQLALVEQATFELVAVLAASSSAYSASDTGQNVKALGAGKARVEFFAPTRTNNGTASKLPTVADELIGMWIAGGSGGVPVSVGGSSASSSTSNFQTCTTKRNEPL